MKRTCIGQQGEVKIFVISFLPEDAIVVADHERNLLGLAIISHSEKGHHHVISDADVAVMERPRQKDRPAGVQILYALVGNPGTALIQDAGATSHGAIPLPQGYIEFRIGREVNPFSQEIQRIKD